jgi:hypothetical protein
VFGLGPATKIYLCLDSVDMRKGFDGLYGLVRDHLGQDPRVWVCHDIVLRRHDWDYGGPVDGMANGLIHVIVGVDSLPQKPIS